MKIRWIAPLVLAMGCKPSPPETKPLGDQRPGDITWSAKFGAAPFKNAEVLNYGEVVELAPAEIVDRHLARIAEDWVYDFDLLKGGPATALKKGVVNPGEPRFIVSNGTLSAVRGDGKVVVLDASKQEVGQFDAASVAWARGASEQAAMAWEGDVLWVLTKDAVLRWEGGVVATLFKHDHLIRRVAFLSGSVSFEHEAGWSVVWPKGSREVAGPGEFLFVWMNSEKTQIWCKSNENVSFAAVDDTQNLVFYPADGLQDADSIFVGEDKMLAQWWPSEALWLSDYAKAAWIEESKPGPTFTWGAAWPQTVQAQGVMTGLGSTPAAIWKHDKATEIELNSAASGALFFDGKMIVRRAGNLVQRLDTQQPSKTFTLRAVRQILCSGQICLALGREGALDRIDLKNRTRETILFIHTGETLPPLLSFTENASVLCEPRCVTKTGEFVSGLVDIDPKTGAITPHPNLEVLNEGVLARRVFKHPTGVNVAISELQRSAHKIGRPPRFFQIDFADLKDGSIAPSEWIIGQEKQVYFATSKTLERLGDKTFKVEVTDGHNLVDVPDGSGARLMHLQGRGPSTKLIIRNGNTGAVISELAAPNVSAFQIVDGRIFYAIDDGRMVLADL